MASFLSVPREIRDMIYEKCLIIDIEINPYPAFYESTTKPNAHDLSVALLRTNRLIGAEARIVLYGQNRWRANAIIDQSTIFDEYPKLFRDLTLGLNHLDVDNDTKSKIYKEIHGLPEDHWVEDDKEAQKAKAIHERCLAEAIHIWGRSVYRFRTICLSGSLILDLKDISCPGGCCRRKLLMPGRLAHNMFGYHLRSRMPGSNFFIKYPVSGLLNDWERDLLRTEYACTPVDAKDLVIEDMEK